MPVQSHVLSAGRGGPLRTLPPTGFGRWHAGRAVTLAHTSARARRIEPRDSTPPRTFTAPRGASRIEQRGGHADVRRRRRGDPGRIGRRDDEVERLAEERLVVDPFVVELVPDAVELAVAALVGRV